MSLAVGVAALRCVPTATARRAPERAEFGAEGVGGAGGAGVASAGVAPPFIAPAGRERARLLVDTPPVALLAGDLAGVADAFRLRAEPATSAARRLRALLCGVCTEGVARPGNHEQRGLAGSGAPSLLVSCDKQRLRRQCGGRGGARRAAHFGEDAGPILFKHLIQDALSRACSVGGQNAARHGHHQVVAQDRVGGHLQRAEQVAQRRAAGVGGQRNDHLSSLLPCADVRGVRDVHAVHWDCWREAAGAEASVSACEHFARNTEIRTRQVPRSQQSGWAAHGVTVIIIRGARSLHFFRFLHLIRLPRRLRHRAILG